MKRRGRPIDPLIEGLTIDERVTRLETAILGTPHRPGIDRTVDQLADSVQGLLSDDRRRSMPWPIRWWLDRGQGR